MVCPYNEFRKCFEKECPFYYKQWQIVDHGNGSRGWVEHCARAEKELSKKKD